MTRSEVYVELSLIADKDRKGSLLLGDAEIRIKVSGGCGVNNFSYQSN